MAYDIFYAATSFVGLSLSASYRCPSQKRYLKKKHLVAQAPDWATHVLTAGILVTEYADGGVCKEAQYV